MVERTCSASVALRYEARIAGKLSNARKRARSDRTPLCHRPHLDDAAVFETGALLSDGDRFGFVRELRIENKIRSPSTPAISSSRCP